MHYANAVLPFIDEAWHMLSVIMLSVILLSVAEPLGAKEYFYAECPYANFYVVLGR